MRRAVRLPLQFVTEKKRNKIKALMLRYRSAVNFYIRSLWEIPGDLDGDTLARLYDTPLSERYKSAALRQALGIISATVASARTLAKKENREYKRPSCPVFRGAAVLDAKVVQIDDHEDSCFDLMFRNILS